LRFTDQAGFTLVETLVAGVILFTCLAAAAVSYNTAVNLTNKLNATIAVATAVPDIRNEVKQQLFDRKFSGEAQFSETLNFSWQASEKRSARTITGTGYERGEGLDYGRFRISLYEVALTVWPSDAHSSYASRYEYTELVWQEMGF
jgi:Tfp pilus assembly protein PilE